MKLPTPPEASNVVDLQKWTDQITSYLGDPEIQLKRIIGGQSKDFNMKVGDVDGGNYFQVDADGNLSLVGTATREWLAYGDMHVHETPVTVTWAGGEADDWKVVTGYEDHGMEKRVTRDETNGILTIDSDGAGVFYLGFSISAKATGGGLELNSAIWLDTGSGFAKLDSASARRTIGAGGNYGSFSVQILQALSAGDVVRIELQSDTASRSIVIDHMQFVIHKIGE